MGIITGGLFLADKVLGLSEKDRQKAYQESLEDPKAIEEVSNYIKDLSSERREELFRKVFSRVSKEEVLEISSIASAFGDIKEALGDNKTDNF